MRRLVYVLFAFVAVMTSCTIETSDNGDFDGFWHLERIDTLSTGGVKDLSNDLIFWNVQYHLVQFEGDTVRFNLRFEQTGDSLILKTPYISKPNEAGWQGADTLITDPTPLGTFGVEGLEVHYHKDQLNGSRMVLRSPQLVLHFKKF